MVAGAGAAKAGATVCEGGAGRGATNVDGAPKPPTVGGSIGCAAAAPDHDATSPKHAANLMPPTFPPTPDPGEAFPRIRFLTEIAANSSLYEGSSPDRPAYLGGAWRRTRRGSRPFVTPGAVC